MSRENGNARWIQRGRQRVAVFQVLRKPMTTSEICRAAHQLNSHIQLRDIWLIMSEFKKRGLAVCLNPKHTTGKLFALTEKGRRLARHAFGFEVPPIPGDIDWRRYAKVVRAKVRKLVLLELAPLPPGTAATATTIRKRLREKHPMGLNPTIRALKELGKLGLVWLTAEPDNGGRRHYRLTGQGAAIERQITA